MTNQVRVRFNSGLIFPPKLQQAREGASENLLAVQNECKAFQQNYKANPGKAPGTSAKDLLADIDVGLHIKNKQQTK